MRKTKLLLVVACALAALCAFATPAFAVSGVEAVDVDPVEKTATLDALVADEADETDKAIDISSGSLTLSQTSYYYQGWSIRPDVTVRVGGKTLSSYYYSVTYENNNAPGTGIVTVTGRSPEYTGTLRAVFEIKERLDLSAAAITLPRNSYTYQGEYIEPVPTVRIGGETIDPEEYTVSYRDNYNVGTATVTVRAISERLTGSGQTTFEITKQGIKVSLSRTSYTYTGDRIEPDVTVKAGDETLSWYEYDVSYSNNVNAGTATVTVTCNSSNYGGTAKTTFKINPVKISHCYMDSVTYTGKKRVPGVYIYTSRTDDYGDSYSVYTPLKQGRDYTIKVSGGAKKIGKYTATIKFKGNYTGTAKKTYKILPKDPVVKKTKTLSASSVSARWSKVKGADGYRVYRYNAKKGKYTLYRTTKSNSCTIARDSKDDHEVSFYVKAYKKAGKKTYLSQYGGYGWEYLKLTAPSFSVKKTDFNRIEIRFKSSFCYQVQVSSNKSFKKGSYPEFVQSWRGYTDTVTGSYSSGEKIYIRARAYYYDKNGTLKVSPWSKTKSVTPY